MGLTSVYSHFGTLFWTQTNLAMQISAALGEAARLPDRDRRRAKILTAPR